MPKESIIQHYSSATTGNIPAAVDLALGELAINTADERVFIKNNAGTVLSLSQTRDLSGAFARTSATVSSVNGFTGAVQVTGSGAVLHSVSGTTTTLGARLATTGASGVASFNATHFSMGSTGHVSLATAYTVTGDTVQAGSGISINAQKVISNTGVLTLPLASAAGATGVASFRSGHFTVDTTGHVQLAAAYQVTGDTVITVANSGIAISTVGNTDTLYNIGVLSLNGFTGAVQVTGSGAILHSVSGTTTTLGARLATTGSSGVASFNATHFSMGSTGHVSLATAYTVTGDTVQAGSGISINAQKVITNTGVLTLPLASAAGATGVASFRNTHFTVDTTGHVQLAAAYQATGDTVQAGSFINIGAGKTINNIGVQSLNGFTGAVQVTGSGAVLHSVSGTTTTFGARLATTGSSGVASFNATHFSMGSTGHVSLATAYTVTGDTVQAGSGISINAQKVISNTGVLTLPLSTAAGATGVASFRNTHFTVDTTGHVQLAAAYQVTGDTVQAGSFINIGAGKTINNIGVHTLNGFTGAVQVTGSGAIVHSVSGTTTTFGARLATTGSSGVASFNATHFSMGSTGHVSLATAYTVTGDTVQAGSGISINAQKVISNTGVLTLPLASAAGATGVASFRNTHFTVGTTGHVQLATAYQVTGDTVQAGSGITISGSKVIANSGVITFNGNSGTVTYAPPLASAAGATGVASFRNTHFTVDTTGHVQLAPAYQVTGDTVVTVANSGIAISTVGNTDTLYNIGVLSLNGFTGAVQVTGSGAILHSVSGTTTTFGARLATTGSSGVASFNATHFSMGSTGHVSLATAYTVTGDTVQAGSGISINAQKVISNTGVLTLPLASAAGATGVASFRNTHFTVDTTGHVQLAAAYQVTGDTVQAGTGITIGAGKTITNAGVVSLNGLVGAVTLTGDGAAQRVLGNNILTNRVATDSATGVAAFNVNDFTVTTPGIVSLKTDKTVFDTVDGAGVKNSYFFGEQLILTGSSGLRVTTSAKSTGFIFTNTGVLSLCGLTGNVCLTGDGGAVAGRNNSFITTRVATAAGATGVASFRNTHFLVDGTGHVQLAAAYQVTGDTVQAGSGISIGAGKTINNTGVLTFNGSSGTVAYAPPIATLSATGVASFDPVFFTTGTSGHIRLAAAYQATGSGIATVPLATTSLTGTASFNLNRFQVSGTGNVDLLAAFQVTGDTVVAGSFINFSQSGTSKTINNIGVQTLNGFTGAVQVTGSGAIVHSVSGTTTTLGARLTTAAGATGVASFRNNHFTVDTTGHVQLAAAYQVTGDTVVTVANSGIAISTVGNTDTLFNIGVLSLNSLTGATTLTGDGGSSLVLGNNRTSNRIATTSLTGVASFLSTHFTVDTTGHVKLATAYTVTGDTVQAGSGISINAQKVITNTGVITLPLATAAGATGVASFRNTHFTVDTTGHVQLATAYQVTGQTVVSGGASQLVSTSGNTVTIDNRIATASATGVASFSSTFFTVSTTGNVQLAAAYQATGGAGGLQTVPLATTSLTGVASFLSTHFTVDTTGHVKLAPAYQVTGDTVITVANSGIAISTVGNTDTLFNIGVLSLNSLTGAITLTGDGGSSLVLGNNRTSNRIATTSLTGVASFSTADFVLGTTGHVSLTGTVAKTNVANRFTALQSFSTGLSASNGITFGSNVTINGNLNATTKSFVIPHPSKSGMTLRYGSLEGPENGVYVRGRLRGGNTIELPDYWTNLVDEESITVNLTPIGSSNQHYVIVASTTQIVVGSGDGNIDCYYMVLGERKDVPKLQVEY